MQPITTVQSGITTAQSGSGASKIPQNAVNVLQDNLLPPPPQGISPEVQQKWKNNFPVLGVVGGCASPQIQFKNSEWKGICEALQGAGWGIDDAIKVMPYIFYDDKTFPYITDRIVTPLDQIIYLDRLPAPFLAAIQSKPNANPAQQQDVVGHAQKNAPTPSNPAPEKKENYLVPIAIILGIAIVAVLGTKMLMSK